MNKPAKVKLIGVPMQCGASRTGCIMGPDAYRTAGILEAFSTLGLEVRDTGNVTPQPTQLPDAHPNPAVHHLGETTGWIAAISDAACEHAADESFPVFLGGDHAMSAGTVSGMARHARKIGKRLFVLWLDAHSDFHTLDTTQSGNLHGTPVAYFTGMPGFSGYFPPLANPVAPADMLMLGIRSVDPAEHKRLLEAGVQVADMRRVDEAGMANILKQFLGQVRQAGGILHVSLDVDFLDPQIAPAVGTTVPGGTTYREAHLVMEILHDSGLAGSLDLAELNPFLDERGRTASLMVDLAASLLGKTVMDRPTRSY